MNFLEQEDNISAATDRNNHTLWVERYRPSTLDEYIGNDSIKNTIKSFIEKNDVPHLLFHGVAGVGKSTLCKLICNTIQCDYITINASDENGIDIIRTKVKEFASNAGFSNIKIILFEECDFLTQSAQKALLQLSETYSASTRFLFTANYLEKIIPPLLSRCQVFEIEPTEKVSVASRLIHILDTEKVSYDLQDVATIVNKHYPDIRKIINFAQQNTNDNKLTVVNDNKLSDNAVEKIINVLVTGNFSNSTFNEVRQLVANGGIKHFEVLYSALYENITKYASDRECIVILIIAEYMYQSSLVVDKEITFMACIAKIIDALK